MVSSVVRLYRIHRDAKQESCQGAVHFGKYILICDALSFVSCCFLSGSSISFYSYSGRTQKQIIDFVRENYVKRQNFQR